MYYRSILDSVRSVLPQRSYITSGKGDTNILITAPHGGGIKPYNIKNRTTGTLLRDTYTRRLTDKLIELFPVSPYYAMSDIHRIKVDLNRNINESTNGDLKAIGVWYDWNDTLYTYRRDIINTFGNGLLIDIHSHNNSDEFQIGYNINSRDYLRLKKNKKYKVSSTLDSFKSNGSLWEMIFGDYSFSNSLVYNDYEVFIPNKRDVFFNGGYNIEYNSGNGIGAIQIECPVSVLKTDLDRVAKTLYFGIEMFIQKFLYK